ncbi:MAG TPA: TetR/AcrR family transcriptional regulator [Ktedonobacteraceae bacterium]|nr:TetR/AcrR family transcriptional regulator [Ktedonobacteraceae bacterium]
MDVQDRRVKRTQHLLAKALIDLTLEKGYDAVTIRDITDKADVGYATFFRHYHDKDALLQEVSEVVLAELKNLLPMGPGEDAVALGKTLFHYVQENNSIIRVLLSSRSSTPLMEHIIDIATDEVLNQNIPLEGSAVPSEVAAYHLVNSSIGLLQWWLEHDMPYPPERMGIIFHELVFQPTLSIAFSPNSLNPENV